MRKSDCLFFVGENGYKIVEEKCARNKPSNSRLRGQLQNTENGGQKMSPREK